MTKSGLLICIALFISGCVYGEQNLCKGESEEQEYAESFLQGNEFKEFEILLKNPEFFSCYFVSQLRTIPESRITLGEDPASERVIWAIRGLRLMTGGTRFSAKTDYIFSKDELTRFSILQLTESDDEFLFFNELMSAPYIHVGPKDVQESVINSWKVWQKSKPNDYPYRLAKGDSNWY